MQNGLDFWLIDMARASESALSECVPKEKLKQAPLPFTKGADSKVVLQFNQVQSATVQAVQEGVSSLDLKSTYVSLMSRLAELDTEDNDKVTVQLTLVTK